MELEGGEVLREVNHGDVAGNKAKVDKREAPRKRLADISNILQQSKPEKVDTKKPSISFGVQQFIDKLQNENMTLMKVLADRNKIIELSGIELQKLRINFQKMQLQNLQFAQANTQMLAELNLAKDRIKVLQHEVGGKTGLLIAMKLELEKKEKVATRKQTSNCKVEIIKNKVLQDSAQTDMMLDLRAKKKRQSQKYQSLENTTDKVEDVKEKVDNKRRRSTRLSLLKSQGQLSEDSFEMDETKFSVSTLVDNSVNESSQKTVEVPDKNEPDSKDPSLSSGGQNPGRTSIGRPSRQASKKINSYKETSLKEKMRRSE